ncbi:MAG: cation diffusion facilitator family transporter [Alphaproteobacteria bacterium]|nr:cation diffusion facilitator family transporter [Alphaproteobacteria bacterium]
MHTHVHTPQPQNNLNAAFKWAVALNVGYVLVEAGSGFMSGSLALLADAAHNLTDVAGLLMAWGAVVAAKRPANSSFTYGYGRATILAALVNAIVIMLGVGAVVWEAVHRFSQPVDVSAGFVMGVATLGIVVNAGTALLFRTERHADLNAEGAFLHMMTDAAVSLGVVLGGLVVFFTGWALVDPIVAIGVSLMVAVATYSLLKSSLRLTLDGVPASVDRDAIKVWFEKQAGVEAVHDLHIWALSTTKSALTAHLIMPEGNPNDGFLAHLAEELEAHFNIQHATIQVEPRKTNCCLCGNEDDQLHRKEYV